MRVLADGRTRRSAEEWRAVMAKFEASGLSALRFCREQKLSRGASSRWRQELGATEAPAPLGRFLEVKPAEPDPAQSVRAGEFELVLPGGVVLRWRP